MSKATNENAQPVLPMISDEEFNTLIRELIAAALAENGEEQKMRKLSPAIRAVIRERGVRLARAMARVHAG